MNQKGFANIIMVVVVVILLSTVGYFALTRKEATTTKNSIDNLSISEKPTLTFNLGAKPFVQINFDWSVAKNFNIYRSVDEATNWQKTISNFPSNAHTAVDYDYPKNAKVLYYRITSIDEQGRESAPSLAASVSITSNQDSTANWKIYSVPGIQFKYPDDWQVKTETAGARTTATFVIPKKSADDPRDPYGETLIISYGPNQGNLTLEEWWREASKSGRSEKVSETTVAGFPAYVLGLPETDAPPQYVFVTKSRAPGGWIFNITARGENVNKVLVTFRAAE